MLRLPSPSLAVPSPALRRPSSTLITSDYTQHTSRGAGRGPGTPHVHPTAPGTAFRHCHPLSVPVSPLSSPLLPGRSFADVAVLPFLTLSHTLFHCYYCWRCRGDGGQDVRLTTACIPLTSPAADQCALIWAPTPFNGHYGTHKATLLPHDGRRHFFPYQLLFMECEDWRRQWCWRWLNGSSSSGNSSTNSIEELVVEVSLPLRACTKVLL